MLSRTIVQLAKGNAAIASSAVLLSSKKKAGGQAKKKPTTTKKQPSTNADTPSSAAAIAVDGSRFTSTAYTSGRTKSSELFKTSFLSSGLVDDLVDAMKKSRNNNTAAQQLQTTKSRRRPLFALASTPEEKAKYDRLVKHNTTLLKKANAAADASDKISALAAANKKATGTTLSVMKATQIPELRKKYSQTKWSKMNAFILGENEKEDMLLSKILLRPSKMSKRRVRSKFYSKSAVRARGGSFSVPKKNLKKPTAMSGKMKQDPLNPVNISGSFFTTYERKQYDRLKKASLHLRDPRKVQASRNRRGLYRFWDKVTRGLKVE